MSLYRKFLDDQGDDGNGNDGANNGANDANTGNQDGQKDYKKLFETLQKESQASYTGLQKTLGKIQRDYDLLKGTHQTVQEQFSALQATHGTTQEAFDALTTRFEATDPELKDLRGYKERTKLIIGKFPALIGFEADGLLPAGSTMEELTTKLTAFQEKMGNLTKIADNQNRDGITPPPPPSGDDTPTSADAFLKAAIEASSKGNFDEYDIQFNKYLTASGKAKKIVP